MEISLDEKTKAQKSLGPKKIQNPDLIYVCVAIAPPDDAKDNKDRFFILTKAQLQNACIKTYSAWMDTKEWKRPRNPASYDCRYWISHVQEYEDNWQLIRDRLKTAAPDPSLESAEE